MNLRENVERIKNLMLFVESSKSPPDEIVSGSYSAKNKSRAYDALHAFQSRASDGFGGKLNTIVNKAIKKYKEKYNVPVDIKSVNVEIDETELEVNWEVKIGKSSDGHHYSQIDSRGSAGGGQNAVLGQLPQMHSYHPNKEESLVDWMDKTITMCFDNNGEERKDCVCQAEKDVSNFCKNKLNIQQAFYKYKNK
jgi:hypothetical protein